MDITALSETDIGRWVKYTNSCNRTEIGRIKSFNTKYIFVVYKCDNQWDRFQDFTGCSTLPSDLEFITEEIANHLIYKEEQ